SLQRLLDADDDGFFHLFRRGARIGHVDLNRARLELGEYLHLDGQRRGEAGEEDEHHQQVRRDRSGSEPGDDALLSGMHRHGVTPAPIAAVTSSIGATLMPSMGTGTGDTMTYSPALSPRSI